MKKRAPSKSAVYKLGADYKITTLGRKAEKRDKVFSKSRDNREDRGTRQMKSSRNVNSFHTFDRVGGKADRLQRVSSEIL